MQNSETESIESILSEVAQLGSEWYRLVSSDHHKDRDCHFYINTVFSYGAVAYYRPEHYGYVYTGDWEREFPKIHRPNLGNTFRGFATYREATIFLRDKLKKMIFHEKDYQRKNGNEI